jgi:hypothetical protein
LTAQHAGDAGHSTVDAGSLDTSPSLCLSDESVAEGRTTRQSGAHGAGMQALEEVLCVLQAGGTTADRWQDSPLTRLLQHDLQVSASVASD